MNSTFPQNQQGLTLLEISIVVLILAITAAVALPNLSTTVPYRLDNAARELAEAIRFARAEAIRTGEARGISYSALSQTLSLYRDDSTPVYDIYHPIDKKLYTMDYSSDGNQAPVQLSSVTFKYGGSGINRAFLSFDQHGTPRYLSGSTYQMLDNADIVLSYAGQSRTVDVSPMTGRVTIQ